MMMMITWQAAWWPSRAPDPQTLETGELPGCEYIGEDDDDHDDDGDDGVDDDVNGAYDDDGVDCARWQQNSEPIGQLWFVPFWRE